MVLYSRLRRRRADLAIALLLTLFFHLAAMASPLHARVMAVNEPHAAATGHTGARGHHSTPDAPVAPHWDACGLEAARPVGEPTVIDVVAVLPYGDQPGLNQHHSPINSLRISDPPRVVDKQALLQVFRL
jgi:hypothetical protein